MRGLSNPPPNPILPLYELPASPSRIPSQPSRHSAEYSPYHDLPSNKSSPSLRTRELQTPRTTSHHLRGESPLSKSSTTARSPQAHQQPPAPLLFSQPATAPEAELVALARQAAHISRTLQTLLDAQSQGLLAGLAGDKSTEPLPGNNSSTPATPTPFSSKQTSRSSTPTVFPRSSSPNSTISTRSHRSVSRSSHVARKQSPTAQLSLHSVRARIPRTLLSLSNLKSQETSILSTSLATLTSHLNSLTAHQTRREALSQKITALNSDPDFGAPNIERLQAQEKEISHEIQELEDRLATLRAKQRHLKDEIEVRTNHLEAKLSSYKTALEDADKDAESRFLRADPLSASSSSSAPAPLSFSRLFPLSNTSDPTPSENQDVWTLPSSRRTLPLVRADLESRIMTLTQRLQASDLEARASAEGAELWNSVREVLAKTETMIQETMSRQQEILARGDLDERRRNEVLQQDTRALVRVVEDALGILRGREEVARERGWSFLVCAIGAEAEALARGREVLLGLLEGDGEKGEGVEKNEVEKALSVQDLRREIKAEQGRPSSAGSGSERVKKAQHGRQSSFPSFGWAKKASAVEPKLTREDGGDDDAQEGREKGIRSRENARVEEENAAGRQMAAAGSEESGTKLAGKGDGGLLRDLAAYETGHGDDDELLRDLMSGGQ